MSGPMKEPMTIYFQGGVLGSHKPLIWTPYALSYPLNQEKALPELEKFQ
jgi:hypothetical protein